MGISAQFLPPSALPRALPLPRTPTSRNVSERSYWRQSQGPRIPSHCEGAGTLVGEASEAPAQLQVLPPPAEKMTGPHWVGRGWSSQTRSQLEWPLLGTKGPAVLSSWEQLQHGSSENTEVLLPLTGEVHRGRIFHWRSHSASELRSPQAFPRNCITVAVP